MHVRARAHTHTHHTHFIDPSSVQWWLEYEIGHKQYWTVIHNLVLVLNIHKYHKV